MTTATIDRPHDTATAAELGWLTRMARAPRLRSIREFAEAEIVLPGGPFVGRRFRCDRLPHTGLWFDEIDSGRWIFHVATGPSQSSKTLCGSIIPTVYHLFEYQENVVLGLPDMNMAADKWREDIEPVIVRSRYRDLIPHKGAGSRGGGSLNAIKFTNGATLKFMSGGGGDKARAGYESRVLVITEADGMDEPGAASRETDKITQMIARTEAHGELQRVYSECTVSVEEGRTWRWYTEGSASRIALPCPHCGGWVTPEREHLVGWQEAATDVEARDKAAFACPACGEAWTENQRVIACRAGLLVHRGQEIKGNRVIGDRPKTTVLGFRWSAINNLFWTAGHVGAREWRASKDPNEDNAEREMLQYVWAKPHQPTTIDLSVLDSEAVKRRVSVLVRGLCPEDTEYLTIGVDLGKFLGHYIVVAWRGERGSHVVDYGVIEIDTDRLGIERGTLIALREFRDGMCDPGWAIPGGTRSPDRSLVDSAYSESQAVVYAFCGESKPARRFLPSRGYGATQHRDKRYARPTKTGSMVRYIGEEYHIAQLRSPRLLLVHVNADYWKSWVHERLSTPMDAMGAMTLFAAPAKEHTKLAKHLTAEKQVEEFVPGKGMVRVWKQIRRNNHWLDALSLAAAAGHSCGVRLVPSATQATAEAGGHEQQEDRGESNWKIGR